MGIIFSKEWAVLLFLLVGVLCGKGVGGVLYYHPDSVQSLSVVTDSERNILQVVTYSPFGEVSQVLSRGGISLASRFATYEADPEVGLLYAEARYYDPTVARFLSPDPLREPTNPPDLNLYAYAWGNPLRQVDPSGRAEEEVGSIQEVLDRYLEAQTANKRAEAVEPIATMIFSTVETLDSTTLTEGFQAIQGISDPERRLEVLQAYLGGLDRLIPPLQGKLQTNQTKAEEISFEKLSGMGAAVSMLGGGVAAVVGRIFLEFIYEPPEPPTEVERYRLRFQPLPPLPTRLMALGRGFGWCFLAGATVLAFVDLGVYWYEYSDDYWEVYQLTGTPFVPFISGYARDVIYFRGEAIRSIEEARAILPLPESQ
ncbi:MAG: RHS repeat-associated core domain-containing protein [Deltaproteobacteria bacterium]|nr:RHS repeat-associated core domain-containing protein [Deltaproteobacteria bacterium]